jgi:hypothetical protein
MFFTIPAMAGGDVNVDQTAGWRHGHNHIGNIHTGDTINDYSNHSIDESNTATGITGGTFGGAGGTATIEEGAVTANGGLGGSAIIEQGAINNSATGGSVTVEEGAVQVENINEQDQKQKQKMKQKQQMEQEQSQTAHNEGVEQSVIVEGDSLIIEAAETKRDHHTGTPVTFASLGTYAESRFAGANFQTVEMMTMFKDTFSYEGALEVYGKPFGKGMCETVGKSYNGRHEDDPSAEIKVFTMKDKVVPDSIESIGFLTIIGREGKGATSFIVMQKAILSAAIMQGDAILVTKEGAETVTKSSGWGIGFNTSGSVINDMDNRGRSAAASGGTGWSTGKGKLEVLPWIVVQVLKFK